MTLLQGEKYALIKIQDNGGGIQGEIIDSIFEPYLQLQTCFKGTGIGLYMWVKLLLTLFS